MAVGANVAVGAAVAVGAGVAKRQLVLKTYVLFGGNTGFSESGGGTTVTSPVSRVGPYETRPTIKPEPGAPNRESEGSAAAFRAELADVEKRADDLRKQLARVQALERRKAELEAEQVTIEAYYQARLAEMQSQYDKLLGEIDDAKRVAQEQVYRTFHDNASVVPPPDHPASPAASASRSRVD